MNAYRKTFLKYLPLLVLLGLGAGLLNGLLGAGGGILIVMGLRALFTKEVPNTKSFYATSIAVMLPLSLFSVWQYVKNGHLPAIPIGTLAPPALLGGTLGALLLRLITPKLLARIFALVVLISGIILVV